MVGIPQTVGRERTIALGEVEIAVTEFPIQDVRRWCCCTASAAAVSHGGL